MEQFPACRPLHLQPPASPTFHIAVFFCPCPKFTYSQFTPPLFSQTNSLRLIFSICVSQARLHLDNLRASAPPPPFRYVHQSIEFWFDQPTIVHSNAFPNLASSMLPSLTEVYGEFTINRRHRTEIASKFNHTMHWSRAFSLGGEFWLSSRHKNQVDCMENQHIRGKEG